MNQKKKKKKLQQEYNNKLKGRVEKYPIWLQEGYVNDQS